MDGPHSVTAFLKPATPGARVTFPMTRDALPEEGAVVELSSYWRERIRDGSVVQVVEERLTVSRAAEVTRARTTRQTPSRPLPDKDD